MNEETNAADLAQRVADLEAIVSAPRGTDAQITKEREISAAAIDGALAFGYQGTDAPEAGHWLLSAHNAGKRIAELEAVSDELRARLAEMTTKEFDLAAERDALRAKLVAIEAQEPVAWMEQEWSGSGERRLHFARRPKTIRDEVTHPVWTALYARPVPAQAVPDLKAFSTSDEGRAEVACFFAEHLRRHDFARYINDTLAADFACALAPTLRAVMAAAPEHKA